jgi:undecaprenyl-diphosphatase
VPFLISNPSVITINFIIGILVSFITGILSIGFLLRYIQTRNFLPFAWYRFILGSLVIVIMLMR